MNKNLKVLSTCVLLGLMPVSFGAQEVPNFDTVAQTTSSEEIIMNSPEPTTTSEEVETIAAVDGELYSIVDAEDSTSGNDVCIYVQSGGSNKYKELVNAEREEWDEEAVLSSRDLEEGSMLRAGENAERYATGKQSSYISHTSDEYDFSDDLTIDGFVAESLAFGTGSYSTSLPYNEYYSEKEYLPEGYDPEDNLDGHMEGTGGKVIGHYATMVNPQVKYVGQGAAFTDDDCDGSVEYVTYANEHSETDTDLYPNFKTELARNNGTEGLTEEDDTEVEEVETEEVETEEDTNSEEVTLEEDTADDGVIPEEVPSEKISEEPVQESTQNSLTNTASTSLIAGMSLMTIAGALVFSVNKKYNK